jgi:hypothetical protein
MELPSYCYLMIKFIVRLKCVRECVSLQVKSTAIQLKILSVKSITPLFSFVLDLCLRRHEIYYRLNVFIG